MDISRFQDSHSKACCYMEIYVMLCYGFQKCWYPIDITNCNGMITCRAHNCRVRWARLTRLPNQGCSVRACLSRRLLPAGAGLGRRPLRLPVWTVRPTLLEPHRTPAPHGPSPRAHLLPGLWQVLQHVWRPQPAPEENARTGPAPGRRLTTGVCGGGGIKPAHRRGPGPTSYRRAWLISAAPRKISKTKQARDKR